jgi:hypothetical protein
MDPLADLLTTQSIQTGWEMSIKLSMHIYSSGVLTTQNANLATAQFEPKSRPEATVLKRQSRTVANSSNTPPTPSRNETCMISQTLCKTEHSMILCRAGSGFGDPGNSNVISENRTQGSRFVSRGSRQDKSRSCFKVVTCFAIHETSKERRKGNSPTPTTLSLYTVRLPPSNHFLSSDVPSESHPMILHTINTTPYQYNHAISSNVATPQTTLFS